MSKKVTNVIKEVEKYCLSNGIKLTDKRKQVLSVLLESGRALSAYEVIDRCNIKYGIKMQAMSAYRMLDLFVTEKLAHKLELANKYVACSHVRCNHSDSITQFLICQTCNKVEEIKISHPVLNEINSNAELKGFKLLTHQLELSCICKDCLNDAA